MSFDWFGCKTWELRKFSDFTFPAGERNKDDLDLEPFAITSNQGFIAQSEAHDDFGYMKDVDRKMYIVVKPNSFAYNPARINVGSLGYYEGAENVIVSSLYEVFQTAEYVDDKFLKHWFKTKAFQDWIERLQEGSVRLYFYYDKLCECIMSMPSVEEQRKIGAYLDKIDNLITLHQRKCETLQKLKKSMLQKMFPKNGSYFPEIRFAGFTDAWELRKLSLSFDILQNNTLSRSELSIENGAARNVHYGDILVKYGEVLDLKTEELPFIQSSQTVDKLKGSFLQNGDIIMADTAEDETAGKCTEIANLDNMNVLAGLHTIPLRPKQKYAVGYLGYYMNSGSFHDKLLPLMQGTKVTSISKSALQGMSILRPADLEEQRQIGTYFRTLDRLITLHQRKLETLKKLKKAMLQKMFI